jgi:hypothetical protein
MRAFYSFKWLLLLPIFREISCAFDSPRRRFLFFLLPEHQFLATTLEKLEGSSRAEKRKIVAQEERSVEISRGTSAKPWYTATV